MHAIWCLNLVPGPKKTNKRNHRRHDPVTWIPRTPHANVHRGAMRFWPLRMEMSKHMAMVCGRGGGGGEGGWRRRWRRRQCQCVLCQNGNITCAARGAPPPHLSRTIWCSILLFSVYVRSIAVVNPFSPIFSTVKFAIRECMHRTRAQETTTTHANKFNYLSTKSASVACIQCRNVEQTKWKWENSEESVNNGIDEKTNIDAIDANESKVKKKKWKKRKVRLRSLALRINTHTLESAEFRLWHFSLLFVFVCCFRAKFNCLSRFDCHLHRKRRFTANERATDRVRARLRSFFFRVSIPLSRCDEKILCL